MTKSLSRTILARTADQNPRKISPGRSKAATRATTQLALIVDVKVGIWFPPLSHSTNFPCSPLAICILYSSPPYDRSKNTRNQSYVAINPRKNPYNDSTDTTSAQKSGSNNPVTAFTEPFYCQMPYRESSPIYSKGNNRLTIHGKV